MEVSDLPLLPKRQGLRTEVHVAGLSISEERACPSDRPTSSLLLLTPFGELELLGITLWLRYLPMFNGEPA
jgi:hypothetical protein